eukprot:1077250-Prymnesium_polylepis.1
MMCEVGEVGARGSARLPCSRARRSPSLPPARRLQEFRWRQSRERKGQCTCMLPEHVLRRRGVL